MAAKRRTVFAASADTVSLPRTVPTYLTIHPISCDSAQILINGTTKTRGAELVADVSHRTVELPSAREFADRAREQWPAPRYTVELDLGQTTRLML